MREYQPEETEVWLGRPPFEEVDGLYQTEDCSSHTYYVATKRPRGPWSSFGTEVKLSGTGSNDDYARNLILFFKGDKRWIVFKRDPNNVYDSNAIEVYGVWTETLTGRVVKARIGWVERAISADLARDIAVNKVIGTPSIFYVGKSSPGLRFRVWVDKTNSDAVEIGSFMQLRTCLTKNEGVTLTEAAAATGLTRGQLRNWLDKLARNEGVTALLMEALSGIRIEKIKNGRNVRYIGFEDSSCTYTRKKGMTDQDIANDPMGADVPGYLFDANGV